MGQVIEHSPATGRSSSSGGDVQRHAHLHLGEVQHTHEHVVRTPAPQQQQTQTQASQSGLSQSGLLVTALFAGFILWLILKGRIGTYWALLVPAPGSSAIGPTGQTLNIPGVTGSPSTAQPSTSGAQPSGFPSVQPPANPTVGA